MVKIKSITQPVHRSHLNIPHFKGSLIAGISVFGLALFMFLWRLSSISLNKINNSELLTKHNLLLNGPWWRSISFISGPYYLLLNATFSLHHNLFSFRLASVIAGILSTMAVYWLIEQWHGWKIALITTATYITSFGVLVSSRQAISISLELLGLVSLVLAMYLIKTWHNTPSLLIMIIIVGIVIYTPGMVWLILMMLLLSAKDLKDLLSELSIIKKISLLLIEIILLAPLGYRLIKFYSTRQTLNWVGYNLQGTSGSAMSNIHAFAVNFYRVPLDIFIRSTNMPANLSLGHLPLLPFTYGILFVIAIYCYANRLSNYRWRYIVIMMIVAWVIVGLGVLSVFVLLPLVFIALGTGFAYMLKQWYSVFPLNPIARNTGLIIISSFVVFSCFYTARSYFVAWANEPSAVNSYNRKLN